MSNAEILEELMWKAYNEGHHKELLDKATELIKKNPLMNLCDAAEIVYHELFSK
jgi:hypothetical protein